METNELLQSAQPLLLPWTERVSAPEPERLDVYLPADKIVEAVQAMVDAGGWHLSAITGLDIPQSTPSQGTPASGATPEGVTSEGAIEILYHFCQGAAVVTLRIQVPYSLPAAPSICGVIPAATLYEREMIEMFGVNLVGTPSQARLLLPDDWPDRIYPLRKSFTGLE
jgi:NADH:ubiquinone oxidoreductase subunit C